MLGVPARQAEHRWLGVRPKRRGGPVAVNLLPRVAELETDLIWLRTCEGMSVAKAKGQFRGKQPRLNRRREAHLVSLVHSSDYSTPEWLQWCLGGPSPRIAENRPPLDRSG